jgi:Domain of unknown function (DUF2017)
MRVRRAKSGALTLSLPHVEALVLRDLPARLRAVLEREAFRDRLVERLFPRAYREEASEAEYRKLVGDELVARKLEGVKTFEETLAACRQRRKEVEITITPEQFQLWLGFVNDMRLLLGTELDVDESFFKQPFDPGHPRAADVALLYYLGWLEEELLRASGFRPLPEPPATPGGG